MPTFRFKMEMKWTATPMTGGIAERRYALRRRKRAKKLAVKTYGFDYIEADWAFGEASDYDVVWILEIEKTGGGAAAAARQAADDLALDFFNQAKVQGRVDGTRPDVTGPL